MNISRYRKPHFIKKEDCDPAIKLIITGAEEGNYSRDGTDETKVVVDLENDIGDKFRFSLNDVNLGTIARQFGDETDEWLGKEIGLRHDPSIEYQGEVRGGIRVIPAEKVPGGPATASTPPPQKPRLTLKRKLHEPAEVRAPVGRTIDDDGMEIPF